MSTLFIHRFAPEYTGFALKSVCVIFLCNGYYFYDESILGIVLHLSLFQSKSNIYISIFWLLGAVVVYIFYCLIAFAWGHVILRIQMAFGIDNKTCRKLMEFESDCYALPLSFCFTMILFWISRLSFEYFEEVEEECPGYVEIEEPLNGDSKGFADIKWIMIYNFFIILLGFGLSQIPYCKSNEEFKVEEDVRETFDLRESDTYTQKSRFSIGNHSISGENHRDMTKSELRHDIIKSFTTELFNNVNGFTFGLGLFLLAGSIFGSSNKSLSYLAVAVFLTHYSPIVLYKRQNSLKESSTKIIGIIEKNKLLDEEEDDEDTLYLEYQHRKTKLMVIALKVCLGWAYEEIVINLIINNFDEEHRTLFSFFFFIIQLFVGSFIQYYISKHNLTVNDLDPEDFNYRFTQDFKKMKKNEQKDKNKLFSQEKDEYISPVIANADIVKSPMQNN
jgi:hypothetical protein